MSQLINFENLEPEKQNKKLAVSAVEQLVEVPISFDEKKYKIMLTLNILKGSYPGKVNYSLKEVASILNVGNEFIRRRIKDKKIKVTYFGDKPMVHIADLANIITEGV